jgi:hypothetical protein
LIDLQEVKKAVLEISSPTDVVIMVVGESQEMSGAQPSRSAWNLPGDQEMLLDAVVATAKRVVLVLLNGRPLDISWATNVVASRDNHQQQCCTHVGTVNSHELSSIEGGDRSLRWGQNLPAGRVPHGGWDPSSGTKMQPMAWAREVDGRTSTNSAAHTSSQDRGNNTGTTWGGNHPK